MSDGKVRASILQMEAWMADPDWVPDATVLAEWNNGFQSAMAQAEKGHGWSDLMARAHAAGQALEVRTRQMEQLLVGVKADLDAQARGDRALKGYGAIPR